ncbi:MAG TPA: dTDP-4-dehydrorhamnose 3,5-epimerase [Sedimenticola sp.]|nr:dTDP-4-dehydrorhamnose 3,5-epimerase [Sedimenticola sp.]
MKVTEMDIPGVLLIEPRVFGDERGWFVETWQQARYAARGMPAGFVQDNQAFSQRGVLRGLHAQHPHDQGKLVQVISGEVFDVAVDIRRGSPWFGRWVGAVLSGENKHQFYVPEGFAHGYCVLSGQALFSYKCTDTYHPETQFAVRWDDPALGIDWPLEGAPILSDKDREAPLLSEIPVERLPVYG